MTEIKNINEIMKIAYNLDNIRCHLFDYVDECNNKHLEDWLYTLQEQTNKLISESWNLYTQYYDPKSETINNQ